MRTMIFGAGGYLGSHLVGRFAEAGPVSGFVRSDTAAAKVQAAGGAPLMGDLADLDGARAALEGADTIIYAAQLLLEPEHDTVAALLDRLQGGGKTFIFTSGTGVLSQRTDGDWSEDTFAEDDPFVPSKYIGARKLTEDLVRAAADRGVRAFVVRPPLIWGHGGCQTVGNIYDSAAKTGAACYVGRGLNLYSNIHVDDLTALYRLVVEKGAPGALYHGVSGEANFRTLAEGVGRVLGVPTRSVTFGEACEIWDKFTALIGMSICSRSRSPRARAELGWRPSPDRLDIVEETAHPAFLARYGRP